MFATADNTGVCIYLLRNQVHVCYSRQQSRVDVFLGSLFSFDRCLASGAALHIILLLYLFCFVLCCGVELPLLDEEERVPSPARPLKIPARARENPRPSYLYFSSVSHECRFFLSWVCIVVLISVLSSCANFRTCWVNFRHMCCNSDVYKFSATLKF